MDTQVELTEVREKELNEPVGEVVIGKVDPRTLTHEEFEKSPELLFHGARDEFEFSRTFDFAKTVNWSTVGSGLYMTPDSENAVRYSEIRKEDAGRSGEPPVIYSFLPYQARMFDGRSQSDSELNAVMPAELMKDYYRFLREKLAGMDQNELLTNHNLRGDYTDTQKRASELAALIRDNKRVGLRHMMNAESEGSTLDRGAVDLRNFMLSKGYDGVIYNEGGDRKDQPSNPSYVFFNLNKVGTYDAWHAKEDPPQSAE